MTDAYFIRDCIRTVSVTPNQGIKITTRRDGETRVFTVTQYLKTLVEMYYNIIDEEKGNLAKLNKCAEAKREIKHQIREYNEDSNALPENYRNIDYSPFLADIDDTYEMLLARVDNEKRVAEISNLRRERIKFWAGALSGFSLATLGWLTFYYHYIKHVI